jgi:hypothetical protein
MGQKWDNLGQIWVNLGIKKLLLAIHYKDFQQPRRVGQKWDNIGSIMGQKWDNLGQMGVKKSRFSSQFS